MNIKLSIIIPIYNSSKYLSECIESVLSQSYENIEVILINDGSTDCSLDISNSYKKRDKRIKIISISNNGVSYARNLGINNSTGDYIMFVDSDDIIDSKCVEFLVKDLKENQLNVGKLMKFKNKVKKTKKNRNSFLLEKNSFGELCKLHLLNTPCCKLYSKKTISENNIFFDINMCLGEDLLFNLKYINHIEHIKIKNDFLYFYRIYGNDSLCTRYYSNMEDIQLSLLNEFHNTFSNEKNAEKYEFEFIDNILQNEFNNSKISYIKKYFNIRKKIKTKKIQMYINKYKNSLTELEFFTLKHNLYLLYKIIKKLKIGGSI